MLHMKYNDKIYSRQVPENLKHSWKYELFTYKHIGGLFCKKNNFYTFFGTNNYSKIIPFKI